MARTRNPVCTPGISKPCGASCIPPDNCCHKEYTTAVVGFVREPGVKYCTPGVSKPCGAGCITLDKTCRKETTCAQMKPC